jgi:hypothetical protein
MNFSFFAYEEKLDTEEISSEISVKGQRLKDT